MLVVFTGIPVTAPGKAAFDKKAVAKVIFIYLVSKILASVRVDFTACGEI